MLHNFNIASSSTAFTPYFERASLLSVLLRICKGAMSEVAACTVWGFTVFPICLHVCVKIKMAVPILVHLQKSQGEFLASQQFNPHYLFILIIAEGNQYFQGQALGRQRSQQSQTTQFLAVCVVFGKLRCQICNFIHSVPKMACLFLNIRRGGLDFPLCSNTIVVLQGENVLAFQKGNDELSGVESIFS